MNHALINKISDQGYKQIYVEGAYRMIANKIEFFCELAPQSINTNAILDFLNTTNTKQSVIDELLQQKLMNINDATYIATTIFDYITNTLTINGTCWFCDDVPGDMKSVFNKELFLELSRRNIIVSRSVSYQKLELTIPRCESCKKIHNRGWYIVFGFLALGIFTMSISAVIMAGLLGFGARWIYQKATSHNLPIKDTTNSDLEEHPLIGAMLMNNWQFKKPQA